MNRCQASLNQMNGRIHQKLNWTQHGDKWTAYGYGADSPEYTIFQTKILSNDTHYQYVCCENLLRYKFNKMPLIRIERGIPVFRNVIAIDDTLFGCFSKVQKVEEMVRTASSEEDVFRAKIAMRD
jgi:hypothetical protein